MRGDVVQSVKDRWSHVTATWTNHKYTCVNHVGDTSEATSYSKKRKLNMAKSLIVTPGEKDNKKPLKCSGKESPQNQCLDNCN